MATKSTKQYVLEKAALNGYIRVVEKLSQRTDVSGLNSAMAMAAREGHTGVIFFLRSKGADDLNRALIEAAGAGRMGMVKYLESIGATHLEQAMIAAAQSGFIEIVIYLRSKLEVTYAMDASINAGICGAAFHSHLKVVEYLSDSQKIDWNTVLISAARGGSIDVIKYCISKGAGSFSDGLVESARFGRLETVKFFAERIDLVTTDITPALNSAMDAAARHFYPEVVEYLESKGASGWDSGMIAAAEGGSIEMVKHFESMGGNRVEGMIAAARFGHLEIVKYLKERCNPTTPDLIRAAMDGIEWWSGSIDVINYLAEQIGEGWRPILEAIASSASKFSSS